MVYPVNLINTDPNTIGFTHADRLRVQMNGCYLGYTRDLGVLIDISDSKLPLPVIQGCTVASQLLS